MVSRLRQWDSRVSAQEHWCALSWYLWFESPFLEAALEALPTQFELVLVPLSAHDKQAYKPPRINNKRPEQLNTTRPTGYLNRFEELGLSDECRQYSREQWVEKNNSNNVPHCTFLTDYTYWLTLPKCSDNVLKPLVQWTPCKEQKEIDNWERFCTSALSANLRVIYRVLFLEVMGARRLNLAWWDRIFSSRVGNR